MRASPHYYPDIRSNLMQVLAVNGGELWFDKVEKPDPEFISHWPAKTIVIKGGMCLT